MGMCAGGVTGGKKLQSSSSLLENLRNVARRLQKGSMCVAVQSSTGADIGRFLQHSSNVAGTFRCCTATFLQLSWNLLATECAVWASLKVFRPSYSADDTWKTGKFIYTIPTLGDIVCIKLQSHPKNTYVFVFNLFWQGGRWLPWLWDSLTTLTRDSPTTLVKYTVCLKKCNYLESIWMVRKIVSDESCRMSRGT